MRILFVLLALFITSCAVIDWKEQTVQDITDKTNKNRHIRAITQFEVKSVGVGSGLESGQWYLNSALNYRSSYSLNVHLTATVAVQFSQKYNIKNPTELIGKEIKVQGTAIAKPFCVHFGCPSRISPNTPEMYLQTQLLITELSNISIQ
jgi:hypothetical protein